VQGAREQGSKGKPIINKYKKMETNWLMEIKHLPDITTSKSFVKKFNTDLQNEFKLLTGKTFDGKRFYFFTQNNTIEYFLAAEVPFARLKGVLLLIRGRVEVNIIWFDSVNKKIISPSEDVSNTEIEFHWENLEADAEWIKLLPDAAKDIRETYSLNVPFPVLSYSGFIGTDVSLLITLVKQKDIEILIEV
jgi:hypothetical protein